MNYTVLLYYKFISLSDPESWVKSQRTLCESLNLKGRILIGAEGINGTVAGTEEDIEAYKQAMWESEAFADLVFKESKAEILPFPKLKVKLRPEIISLHQEIELEHKGNYISPEGLEELYSSEQEFYIVDTRNNYESREGAFEGAITPDIDNFRDLPEKLKELESLKNKTIVTYCTGGIRCEKASALFKEAGFEEVYQLEGGIVSYIMQYPHRRFQGDCYVFDDRMRLTQDELAKHGAISLAPQSQGQQ